MKDLGDYLINIPSNTTPRIQEAHILGIPLVGIVDTNCDPEEIDYAHPIIEKHLSVTYGIMVYQEQAMFLARDMAGFTWQQVDKLRKAISKKSGKSMYQIPFSLLNKRVFVPSLLNLSLSFSSSFSSPIYLSVI